MLKFWFKRQSLLFTESPDDVEQALQGITAAQLSDVANTAERALDELQGIDEGDLDTLTALLKDMASDDV